ncbi:hypothetical protein BC440_07365 [Thalassospira sp. MIT1004]|nr:hypothetical protein [Thalassospira sp.]OHZ00672.1 hypothetical protein BC440_07365 [Thalassospira sp. MIT1004]
MIGRRHSETNPAQFVAGFLFGRTAQNVGEGGAEKASIGKSQKKSKITRILLRCYFYSCFPVIFFCFLLRPGHLAQVLFRRRACFLYAYWQQSLPQFYERLRYVFRNDLAPLAEDQKATYFTFVQDVLTKIHR